VLDASLTGGGIRTSGAIERSAWQATVAGGATAMRVRQGTAEAGRQSAWLMADARASRRLLWSGVGVLGRVHVDGGRHGTDGVAHLGLTGALSVDPPLLPRMQGTVTHVRDGSTAARPFERVTAGGAAATVMDPGPMPHRIAMPALHAGALAGRAITTARVDLALGPVAPYLWTARAEGGPTSRWQRVVGAEARFGTVATPVATLPRVDLAGGVGHAIDDPRTGRTTVYVSVLYRP